MISWRSRWFKVATGDQCLFFRKKFFDKVGGFPLIPLMEDVALTSQVRWIAPHHIPQSPVVTSSRRWEKHGVWKTIFLMWWLRFAFYIGISPERLYRWYYR